MTFDSRGPQPVALESVFAPDVLQLRGVVSPDIDRQADMAESSDRRLGRGRTWLVLEASDPADPAQLALENRDPFGSLYPGAFGGTEDGPAPAVVRLREAPLVEDKFEVLQKWEGEVVWVRATEFRVRLYDLTNPCMPKELATIEVSEVAPDDLELLREGAIFYWTIGYETDRVGQKKRVSQFRFRRLPAWSRREMAQLNVVARSFDELFELDDDGRQTSSG